MSGRSRLCDIVSCIDSGDNTDCFGYFTGKMSLLGMAGTGDLKPTGVFNLAEAILKLFVFESLYTGTQTLPRPIV